MILVLPETLIGILLCTSITLSIVYIGYCFYVERKKSKLVNNVLIKVDKCDADKLAKQIYEQAKNHKRKQGI